MIASSSSTTSWRPGAIDALARIVRSAGAELVGIAAIVEKDFEGAAPSWPTGACRLWRWRRSWI